MTWTNNREGNEVIWKRLDRGFANNQWFMNYDTVHLVNLPVLYSDHIAMILSTKNDITLPKDPIGSNLCG